MEVEKVQSHACVLYSLNTSFNNAPKMPLQIDSLRSTFDKDLYDMEKEANRLQSEMRRLQDRRDIEYRDLEKKLVDLQESLNRLNHED